MSRNLQQTLISFSIIKYSFRRITTNYISSQNLIGRLYAVHACGMRKVNAAASETALNCRQQISVTDSFDFESQSRLHHCETKTARDKSILLYWSVHIDVPAFLLPKCRLQLNDRLDGIWFCDNLFFRRVSETTPPKMGQGQKNDIQTDRRKTRDRMRQKECRIP